MDGVSDDYPKQIVTPFGHTPMVQQGVIVKPSTGLKALMLRLADESVKDLNPEVCVGPLKKRMAR